MPSCGFFSIVAVMTLLIHSGQAAAALSSGDYWLLKEPVSAANYRGACNSQGMYPLALGPRSLQHVYQLLSEAGCSARISSTSRAGSPRLQQITGQTVKIDVERQEIEDGQHLKVFVDMEGLLRPLCYNPIPVTKKQAFRSSHPVAAPRTLDRSAPSSTRKDAKNQGLYAEVEQLRADIAHLKSALVEVQGQMGRLRSQIKLEPSPMSRVLWSPTDDGPVAMVTE